MTIATALAAASLAWACALQVLLARAAGREKALGATLREYRGRIDEVQTMAANREAGATCNLCGGPRCLACTAHLTGDRDDGYCSEGCATSPAHMPEPMGFSREVRAK